jgi:N-carbamoylputrescine amidase
LIGLAQQSGIFILAGLAESEGNAIYATHLVISPEGFIGRYRKLHLGPTETKFLTPGSDIPLFAFGETTFGIQLCYDAHFPELSSIMALRGADILFFPHGSPKGTPRQKLESWMRHLPARAFDNSVFVVACNQCGENGSGLTFPGTAVIFSPEGHVLQQFTNNQETMLTAVLKCSDLEVVRGHRMRYFLPHRRPELYSGLAGSIEARRSPLENGFNNNPSLPSKN